MSILRMGMIGGGPGSMIGDIHRTAAAANNKAKLVCGAFSSDPDKSLEKGKELGLATNRIYSTYQEMIKEESKMKDGEAMNYIAIATPNHLHYEPMKLALEHGFHVMCDKPYTFSYKEAKQINAIRKEKNLLVGVTYTYRGYEMIRKAEALISKNYIGEIRKIKVDYTQEWLSDLIEAENQKQASWRTDPTKSGVGGTIADIGTHAFDLLESVSKLKATSLVTDLSTLVTGRKIDDDANILLRLDNEASGLISVSQACPGEANDLSIKIYGDKAALQWEHRHSNELIIIHKGGDREKLSTIPNPLKAEIKDNLPGHSPDFVQAFISIYDHFNTKVYNIIHHQNHLPEKSFNLPDHEDGLRGMLFIEKAVESSQKRKWVDFSE